MHSIAFVLCRVGLVRSQQTNVVLNWITLYKAGAVNQRIKQTTKHIRKANRAICDVLD